MPLRWYLNPWESVTKGGHTILHGRVWNYVPLDATGIMQANVIPGPAKNWTLTALDAPDTVHNNAVLDPLVFEIPFRDSVGNYLGVDADLLSVTAARRTTITNAFSSRRIPGQVLTIASPRIRHVLRFLIRFLMCTRDLGADFPETDLTTTFGSLPVSQQDAITDWLTRRTIWGGQVGSGTTIGELLDIAGLYLQAHRPVVMCGVAL